jgi:hypothetical protein
VEDAAAAVEKGKRWKTMMMATAEGGGCWWWGGCVSDLSNDRGRRLTALLSLCV